jgi:ubiquinone biosynthesis protein UbiJ
MTMKPRFTILGLMILVGVVGIALSCMLMVVRAHQAMQFAVMRERERAVLEYTRAQALLAVNLSRQTVQPLANDKGETTGAPRPSAGAETSPDELERLRRENAALRARVEELERKQKPDGGRPAPPPGARVP